MEIKALYTVREVAEMFGIPSMTIHRMCRAGHIPHERIGRRVFITLETLQDRPRIWESIKLRTAFE